MFEACLHEQAARNPEHPIVGGHLLGGSRSVPKVTTVLDTRPNLRSIKINEEGSGKNITIL